MEAYQKFRRIRLLVELDISFDCIVLSETNNLVISNTSIIITPGYITVYNCGKFNQHDGVMIIVKSNIYGYHTTQKLSDSLLLKVKLRITNITLMINAIYGCN